MELGEALFEDLVVRLTPRAGVAVVTDPDRRAEARYIISGRASVRGEKARIFFRIARASGGAEMRAGTEEASDEEIWELPGRVADKIAAQLRELMIAGDGAEFANKENEELNSQELLAKAAWHMSRFRRENWRAAETALEAAVQRSPDNPVALSMLASMATQMIPHVPFDELPKDVDRAIALAERAVELGQSIDWVLRTRGNLLLWLLGDHEGARLDCQRALEINPVFHLAHLTIATSEILSGQYEAGAQRLEEMMRRSPVDPQNPLYYSLIALAALLEGDEGRAIAAAREGYERNPFGSWNALVFAAAASEDRATSSSSGFRRMVQRVDLPAEHFYDLPFADLSNAELLVSRARSAGV
jgi:tetratricopeptide (TPR) repeat protein